MSKRYVFSNKQFARVIVAGMAAAAILTEEEAAALTSVAELAASYETTENGVIVSLGIPAKAGVTDGDEGPSSAAVKAALEKAMEHPPWLNSINAWDAKQKRAALKWAKNPTAMAKPDFVKERQPRSKNKKSKSGPKESSEAAPVSERKVLTAPNGAASVLKEFVDNEATEATAAS